MVAFALHPGSRRSALLRHWLLLCVVAVLGQATAPALAWCVHDADHGTHLESALNDCSDHAGPQHDHGDASCHDGAVVTEHFMLDAETPGKVSPTATLVDSSGPPRVELRLSLDEWLPEAAGPAAIHPAPAAHGPGLPGIGQLAGRTTHLLI